MSTDNLSDAAIRKAKPGEKPRKLSDGGGLYLELRPNGARWWRLKYRHGSKEKRLSLGVYPAVGLADARIRRDEARVLLAAGIDPSEVRKADKLADELARAAQDRDDAGLPAVGSFEHVAREWLGMVHRPKVSEGCAMRTEARLVADVFPWIGRKSARAITAPMVLELLRRVEARGAAYSAMRVKQTCGMVFRYAIATGHCERDPTPDLRGAIAPAVSKHYAAITDPAKLGELLRAVDDYGGHPTTRSAIQIAALTFQRPGNVRTMRWAEIDMENSLWIIPGADMKRNKQAKATGPEHLVPLAAQAVALLQALRPLTGSGEYCFPGMRTRSRPISNITMNAAMRRMGFAQDEMTAHGFRATARTIIGERLPAIDPAWIEAQLAHGKKDANRGAYDRTRYLDARRTVMQTWANYLDELRAGAKVLPFGARTAERDIQD
jgi:integrase